MQANGDTSGGRPRPVLVLGGRGFIGGHVCRRLLARGYAVRVLSASDAPLANLADLPEEQRAHLDLVRGDVDDIGSIASALEGCSSMIHAAIPFPRYSLGWRKRWELDRRGLQNVLTAALKASLDKCVFVSVSGTIGATSTGPADESSPYKSLRAWRSHEAKHLAEQDILASVEQGLPATLVNPCVCFGAYDTRPSSGEFIRRFMRFPLRFLDDQELNVVDVEDVASGTVAALERGRVGERYLLCGERLRIGELADRVRRIAGRPRPLLLLPTFLIVATALGSELLGLLLRKPSPTIPLAGINVLRHGGGRYSLEKARRELGFEPRPIDAALHNAVQWLRSRDG